MKDERNFVFVVLMKSGNKFSWPIKFEKIEATMQLYSKAMRNLPGATDEGLIYLLAEGSGISSQNMARAENIEAVYWYEAVKEPAISISEQMLANQKKMLKYIQDEHNDSADDWKKKGKSTEEEET